MTEETFDSTLTDETVELKENEREPLLKKISAMSIAQKVALATKGNKEARAILIREANKMICMAVIKSPRITEPEVVAAAQSRSVNEEVIRYIAGSKDLTRSYGVKFALANNPKTPVPVALKFLTLLRQNDLRVISQSRSVSNAVATQAKALIKQRTGG